MEFFDNRNLHERVYLYMRDQILQNELPPGTKIEYEQFMTALGVSRTPLRDAINQLKQDGLIEVRPRSGSYVAIPQVKDIQDIYEVRKALECQALEVAIRSISKDTMERLLKETNEAETQINKGNVQPFFSADRNLHLTIIQHSNNALLISIMRNLELKIKWFGVIITKNFDRPLQANELHKKILLAMLDSDLEKSKRLLEYHIDEIKAHTMKDYAL